MTIRAPLAAVLLIVLASSTGAAEPDAALDPTPANVVDASSRLGLYFRLTGLFLVPVPKSGEVELTNVNGPARLALQNGPIAGSSAGMGSTAMFAITFGYELPILNRQLSVETILGIPPTLKLYAGGTMATRSLAPTVLGGIPTGVPALGAELGETKVIPPVLTVVYRFLPEFRAHPYVGLGISVLVPYDSKITNPILNEVQAPTLEIPAAAGFVMQAGVDVHLYKWFFATADFKYIAGLDLTAKLKDIWVRIPDLPLYQSVRVGDSLVHVSVNPLVFQVGVGMNF